MIFAVTDIETTGSHASENSITEIAVVLTDGEQVLDTFHTLVRPDHEIPHYITTLTGITNEMVAEAPTFEDIADELLSFYEDSVFVAHNAGFDYAFIKKAFEGVGTRYNPQRLCTVRLARKILPGHRSYSLGTLCEAIGIENEARHRALGDTMATVELFHRLTLSDDEGIITASLKKGSGEQWLPNKLPQETFLTLPEKPGVYYMLDEGGKILYIGMSANIKKRIRQHFGGKMASERRQTFLREVADIRVELTGTELLARLLEDAEIRKHWPPFNRAQKRPIRHYSIYRYADQEGYNRMTVHQVKTRSSSELTFSSLSDAKSWLQSFVHSNNLHNEICGLPSDGLPRPPVKEHNELLQAAWTSLPVAEEKTIIRVAGRNAKESGFIWLSFGRLRGYGFVPYDAQVASDEDLEAYLQPLTESELTDSILRSALEAQTA